MSSELSMLLDVVVVVIRLIVLVVRHTFNGDVAAGLHDVDSIRDGDRVSSRILEKSRLDLQPNLLGVFAHLGWKRVEGIKRKNCGCVSDLFYLTQSADTEKIIPKDRRS